MRVSLIGAGNLATNLAHALLKANHNILAVYSRTMSSASLLANQIGATATDDIMLLHDDADVFIIAVKDDVIADVAAILRQRMPDALIAHTAGTVAMSAIPGSHRGVFYPMQTFSKQRIVDFRNIPLFVEAQEENDLKVLTSLAESLSDSVMHLDDERRKLLHLAAVFCCNFANHCSAIAEKILTDNGIPFDVMLPLVNETNAKLNQCAPHDAQTGPAVREDHHVMDAHINLLNGLDMTQFAEIYKILSDSIINLKKNNNHEMQDKE